MAIAFALPDSSPVAGSSEPDWALFAVPAAPPVAWKVMGAEAIVAPWACTVTDVVPNGRVKLCVVDCPAGTVMGAGDVALVPLNVIVNSVEPSAASSDALSVIETLPPVAVAHQQ